MTLKEVDWRIEKINARMEGEVKLQATLHKMEFKTRVNNDDFPVITRDKSKKLDDLISKKLKGKTHGHRSN